MQPKRDPERRKKPLGCGRHGRDLAEINPFCRNGLPSDEVRERTRDDQASSGALEAQPQAAMSERRGGSRD